MPPEADAVTRRMVAIACVVAGWSVTAAVEAAETRTVSQPFIGVTHTRIDTTNPRTLSMNLVEIDLTVPGIGFAVTPSNGAAAGETVGRTTRQFLTEQAVQVAVNGGFSAWVSGGNYAVEGLAARQGVVYSEFEEFRTFALNISQDNVATILRSISGTGTDRTPDISLDNTLAGEARLLRNGSIVQYANESLQPRTAVGLSADETRLYLMTIDGRNTGHSLGVTRPELADLMRINGVSNAINLDGGGSTTTTDAEGNVVTTSDAAADTGAGVLHGTTLISTLFNPGGTQLDPASVNEVDSANDMTLAITVQNSGDATEVSVKVNVVLRAKGMDDRTLPTGEITTLDPGAQGTVEIPFGLSDIVFDSVVTAKVTVEKVPGEQNIDNNIGVYQIQFRLKPA